MANGDKLLLAINLGYWVSRRYGDRGWMVGRDNAGVLSGPYRQKSDARKVMIQLAESSQRLIDLANGKE